jgi:peptide/nickel transport system ATP-binding protein
MKSHHGSPILQVENLSIGIKKSDQTIALTDGVSFDLFPGEIHGLIGESGCGKSITSLALMGLLPEPGGVLLSGRVTLGEDNIFTLEDEKLNQLRGKKISMIFQEPFAAMNPLIRIGDQMLEVFEYHQADYNPGQKIRELLNEVGLTDHRRILQSYPHELSGGMLQRIIIAMSLLLDPDILIADEPTTALDVTVQAQIMNLIVRLKNQRKMSVLLISHNISLMAQYADRISVMYAGQIVEDNSVDNFLKHSKHPYSHGLMEAIPSLDRTDHKIKSIPGQVPEPGSFGGECRFMERCSKAFDRCKVMPMLKESEDGGSYRCHL